MGIKNVTGLSAVAAIAVTGLAAPAMAYDREAYSYAAGHMMTLKDVPATISQGMKSNGYFNAGSDSNKSWMCNKDDKDISYSGGKYRFSMNYQGKGDGGAGINSQIQQYASATKAIAAFNSLKKAAQACSGPASGSNSFTDESGATQTDSWSSLITTGSVPLVTITGVASIFVNSNYEDISTDRDSPYTSDNYTVYTLVDDVIISTNFYTGSALNLTTAQKKAVNMAAFNSVDSWLG